MESVYFKNDETRRGALLEVAAWQILWEVRNNKVGARLEAEVVGDILTGLSEMSEKCLYQVYNLLADELGKLSV